MRNINAENLYRFGAKYKKIMTNLMERIHETYGIKS